MNYQESIWQRFCSGRIIESLRMNTGKGWREIGENGSQFLWRRNLVRRVMSKLKVVVSRMKSVDLVFSHFLSLIFILFSIYFRIFLFIELRVRVIHVTQEERHRRH